MPARGSFFVCALFSLLIPNLLSAQETRFELGQRLRALERTLSTHSSAEARKRALEPLVQATPTFFSGQQAKAASLLDQARLLLEHSDEIPQETLWAQSLVVRPSTRLIETTTREITLRVESFYPVSSKQPQKVRLRFTLERGDTVNARFEVRIEKLPCTHALPLKDISEGDYLLKSELLLADKVLARSEQTLSLAGNLSTRLDRLSKRLTEWEGKPASVESATVRRLHQLLSDLHAGKTLETNFPAARLLVEAEQAMDALQKGERYYGPKRSGQFWLTLASGGQTDSVRVQIPETASKGKKLPLVVALHGAGGSENMFFDGYGDGLVARLCANRGWLLVTTRTPLLAFGGGPDVFRVVDALAKLYPVDTSKVFLIGHSMGAAQAVAAAARQPERVRAVAALGGGGGFKRSEALKQVRFFVGCGQRDFALNGARTLHRSLVQAGVQKAIFKEYPDVEHLIIVQLALEEVFRFFDDALKS